MSTVIVRKSCQIFIGQVEKSACLTPAQKQILRCLLFTFYNVSDGKCYPSDKTIARETGLSERTIRRAREELVVDEWIECTPYLSDRRRRKYAFPKLNRIIEDNPGATENCLSQHSKRRTSCPKQPDNLSDPLKYKNKPTQIDHEERQPEGRWPVIVGSQQNRAWNRFLCDANLPPLEQIFEPQTFRGKAVYWVKHEKIPLEDTTAYELELNWFRQQVDLSKINQKGKSDE